MNRGKETGTGTEKHEKTENNTEHEADKENKRNITET